MARADDSLPKCVYLKHGKYYFVKRGKWHMLGPCKETLHEKILAIETEHNNVPEELAGGLENYLRRKVSLLKQRPETRTGRLKEVTITNDYVVELARRNGWRCGVSGIQLSLEKVGGGRPYAPSIDRIDCSKDYHPENIRVVCIAVNLAMNVWGEDVLSKIAASMRHAKRVLDKRVLDRQLNSAPDRPQTRMDKGLAG